MTNPSQWDIKKVKCVAYAKRYLIIWCAFSTFSSPPVTNLEATCGGWPHVVHKMDEAWRISNKECLYWILCAWETITVLGNWDLGIVCYSSWNLLSWLIEVYFIAFKLDKKGKVLHYLKRKRRTQLLTPGNYRKHFFTEKSTLDRALTDYDIKKKQDYCIIRSEHREKCKHCPNQKNHQTSPCLE